MKVFDGSERFAKLTARLSLPLIAAPMFQVSGVDLVIAACNVGVIGAFPTANCRSVQELQNWIDQIKAGRVENAAPFCPNLIMRRETLAEELACLCRNEVEIVITSVGSPAPVLPALHDIGCIVFADVASVAHARKAVEAGVDGLILLSAGAGGQTGSANGFAFVRAVRDFFDGPMVLAGGISDGWSLLAARALGCDLAYMGTRFMATKESMASAAYKAMLVESALDDVMLTSAFTGLDASILKPSIRAAGLDPQSLPADMSAEGAARMYGSGGSVDARRWTDIWSAGHSVSGVRDIPSVSGLVQRIAAEYAAAAISASKLITCS